MDAMSSEAPAQQASSEEKSIEFQQDSKGNTIQDPDNEPTNEEHLNGTRLALSVFSVIITLFLVGLDGTIVSTAIPSIVDEFHSLNEVGWYGSVYFLTASMNAVWGKAYTCFPLKSGYMLAIFLFELGSLICGVSPNSLAFILGRAISGAGAAGIQAGGYTMLALSTPAKKRPVFIGAMGACYNIASALGPIIGGAFTSNTTWRWCFYINLPLGGLAFAAVLFGFRQPASSRPLARSLMEKLLNLNPISYALWCAAVVCYLLAMQYGGQTKPWSDPTVIGTLVGFITILIAWIMWDQYSGDRALLEARLFKMRAVASACAFNFFYTGIYSIMMYYIPLYFQAVKGVSAQESGVRSLALVIPLALTFIASGLYLRKIGYHKVLLIAGSAIGTVASGLVYTWSASTPSGHWIGYQILLGIAVGSAGQASMVAALSAVRPADIPATTAVVCFFQTISGAFFISAANCAFNNQLIVNVRKYASNVDPQEIYAAGGGTNLPQTFSGSTLVGVTKAYMQGLRTAYIVALACGGLAFLLSFTSEWRKVNMQRMGNANPKGTGGQDEKS